MNNKKYVYNIDNYKKINNSNRLVLIAKDKFSILVMNKTGYDILCLMDGNNTVSDIVKKIKCQYDTDEDIVESYSLKFIEKMVDKHVVKERDTEDLDKNINQKLNRVYLKIGRIKKLSEEIDNIIETIEKNEHEKIVNFFIEADEYATKEDIIKVLKSVANRKFAKIFFFAKEEFFQLEFFQEFQGKIDVMVYTIASYDKKVDLKSISEKQVMCKQHKMKFFINMLVDDEHLEQCLIIQQDINDYGVNGMFINDKNIIDRKAYEQMMEQLLLKNSFINSWKNNRLKDNNERFYVLTEQELCLSCIYSNKVKYHCGMGIEEIEIEQDGRIYPCHLAPKDGFYFNSIDEYYDQCNLKFGSVLKAEACKSCDAWWLCLGGCKVKNQKQGKKLNEIRPDCQEQAAKIEKYYEKL